MRFEYNNPVLKPRRKDLRNRATAAENLLWKHLKRSQLQGFKFVRQYSVGPYILDFYCPKARLAIELDGSQHATDDGKTYDRERLDFIKDRDIRILRFWNNAVLKDPEEVILRIKRALPPS